MKRDYDDEMDIDVGVQDLLKNIGAPGIFNVQFNSRGYKIDLKKELGIKVTDINSELSTQPSKYAWFATLSAYAQRIAAGMEVKRKAVFSELWIELKDKAEKDGHRHTEKSLEAAVRSHKRFRKVVEEENTAKLNADLLSGAVEAMRQRKDMLIALANNLRQERDTELSILKDSARNKFLGRK